MMSSAESSSVVTIILVIEEFSTKVDKQCKHITKIKTEKI